ncbi:hypothetical protein DU478_03780 [Thalassococcus profundi]|uniref:Desulfoferrodoxin ferrous iron-binding domain-containing protein n=1 Tax=Thalassococcus profundi TaxID=2282382 RepID=A0A369TRV1_9RHOB|nr:hypothetical protein [Thalassococcus profundi]RDD67900.1 hypothetical protein DU478_03780 [Thalassococcus profundi]
MKPIAVILALSTPALALAEEPEVVAATAEKVGMGWRFEVTLKHPDTGWDHYADGWDVVDADGHVIAVRELMHPHVAEQPFTRSLSAVTVPDGTRRVFIRAKCSVHGWTGPVYEMELSPEG